MRPVRNLLLISSLLIGLNIQYASAEIKNAGFVVWETSMLDIVDTENVPINRSQLIFIRMPDSLPSSTHVNIAIDDNHHISLGTGHISTVRLCPGSHKLSTQLTTDVANNLSLSSQSIYAKPEMTHIYQIAPTEQGGINVTPLDMDSLIEGKTVFNYIHTLPTQSHQISRVQAVNCSMVLPTPMFIRDDSDSVSQSKDSSVVESRDNENTEPMFIEFDKPILLDILFDFDKTSIVPRFYQDIAELATFIKSKDASAIIEGHTDNKESSTYNLTLSQARAQAVKDILVTQYDIDADKIEVIGYGDTQPVASNETEAGRQLNRRVVAVAIPKK